MHAVRLAATLTDYAGVAQVESLPMNAFVAGFSRQGQIVPREAVAQMSRPARATFVSEFLEAVLHSDTPIPLDFNGEIGNYAVEQ